MGTQRQYIVAAGEWLLVLPATVLLGGAALRTMGGRGLVFRTGELIFEWSTTHVSRFGAAILFLGLPAAVVAMGGVIVSRIWREDQVLRQDAMATLAILRRHLAAGLVTVATLLAGAILTAAVAHVITD